MTFNSENEIMRALERISVSMELLGRNFIEEEELKKIVPDKETRKQLSFSSLFKKNYDNKFQFEHNNFREYLTAKVISEKPIDIIKEFFAFGPDFIQIIPSRVNTLSFVLSILNQEDIKFKTLVAWVLDNDPEVIINIERDRIDENKRVEIFKYIFNYYKTRKIYINRDKYNYKKLSLFGQSQEVVDFLLDEIEENILLPTLNNSIELLGDMELSSESLARGKKMLTECVLNGPSGVKYSAMRTIADLQLVSKEVLNIILEKYRDSEKDIIRAGIYFMLQNSDYNDEFVDIYLEGLKYQRYENKIVTTNDTSITRLGDEYIYLITGLEKVKDPEALKKIFEYFIVHPDDIRDIHFHNFDLIVSNLISAFKEDPSIFQSVLIFCKLLNRKYLLNELSSFLKFFKETKMDFEAFKFLLDTSKEDLFIWKLIVMLTNSESIDYIINEYKEGKIGENDIWSFRNNLSSENSELFKKFDIEINRISNNKFKVNLERRDYNKERAEALFKYINILFDKETYVAKVEELLKLIDKNEFNIKDIRNIEKISFDEEKPIDFIMNQIKKFVNEVEISKSQLLNIFIEKKWDDFIVHELYSYLNNGWELDLSSDQVDWIFQWCKNKLTSVEFNSALKYNSGKYSSSWDAVYLWFFLRKLSLKYPKNVLLDLLCYDWFEVNDWIGIDYLEEKLSQNEIRKKIIDNFLKGESRSRVLYNLLNYSKKFRLVEIVPSLDAIILNTELEFITRKVALETYLILSESLEKLSGLILKIEDDFKWEVINEIVTANRYDIKQILVEIFEKSEGNDKLKVTYFLLKYQDMTALKYYVTIVKEKMVVPHLGWSLPDYGLGYLHSIDSLPMLIELLDICYQKNFIDNDIYPMSSSILNILTNIAVENPNVNFPKIKEALTKLIERRSSSNKNVNFIYVTIERIEQKLNTIKTSSYSIEEVLNKLTVLNDQ